MCVTIALIYQPVHLSAQEFPVKIYNIKNGLPFQEVFEIHQDQNGLMWFSGRSALISFDGDEWQTIHYPEANSAIHLNKLYFDENGDIWLYTWGKEIFRWDGKKWHDVAINDVRVVQNSFTWFDMVKWGDKHVVSLTNSGKSNLFKGNSWHPVDIPGVTKIDASFTIDDTLVYYADNRLFAYYENEWIDFSLSRVDLSGESISTFYYQTGPTPKLWYAGRHTIGYYENGQKNVLTNLNDYFKNAYLYRWLRIIPDGIGGAIVSSSNHIFRIEPSGDIFSFDVLSGLKTYGATALFIDRERNVWVGCTRGINKIRNFNFQNYRKIHGMLHDEVASIEKVGDKIYLGHYSGITVLQNNSLTKYPIRELTEGERRTNARIMDILPNLNNNHEVWLSSDVKGLYTFSEEHDYECYGLPDGIVNLSTLLQLEDGNLLTGTNKGLFEFDVETKTFKRVYPELMDYIRNIYMNDSGDLYIATRHYGIYKVTDGEILHFESNREKRANSTFNITEYAGEVLVGTDNGLYYINDGQLKPYELEGRTIKEPVYIFIKNKDELWIGGNNGVYRWSENGLLFVSVNDGLAGSECNRTAGLADDKGNVWIGTPEGMSKISGNFESQYDFEVEPEIVSVLVNDNKYLPADFRTTSYDRNNISFKVRYLTYKNEDSAVFEYSLINTTTKEKSRFISEAREAHFLSVSPGTYRFEVKAKYGNQDWSGPVTSRSFTIQTPFTDTIWFSLLLLIILTGVLLLIVRVMLQRRIVKGLADQVEDAKEKTEAIVSTTKTLMLQVDHRGRIKYLSPGIRMALGYEGTDILNRNHIDFIHPEDRLRVYRTGTKIQRGKDNGQSDFQVRLLTNDGEYIWYHVTVSPFKVGDEIWVNIIGQDIEKQKHLEEQLRHAQKLEAVGRLAGGVAHDFNNLLTAIRGYTELAMNEEDDSGLLKDYLEEVENTVDRASKLTGQLLAFSRKQTLKPKYINLNIVIVEMMGMLRSLLGEDIEFNVKTAADLWTVRADVGQLEQVIINLTVNARDAMKKEGKLEIITENTRRKDDSGHEHPYVRLSIIDNGNGIPKDLLERIFEPFFTTKPKGKGTGLGLSTVYGIIRQSEGIIECESEEGQGTSFHIFLPKRDHDAENESMDKIKKVVRRKNGSEKILVVEDEEAVRKFTERVLMKNGFEVYSASSGLEALELIKDFSKLDLVLSDVIMPGMTGPELINILKMKWPETKVVFMSGYAAQHFEENGIDLEEMPLLHKPFKTNELTDLLWDVLERR